MAGHLKNAKETVYTARTQNTIYLRRCTVESREKSFAAIGDRVELQPTVAPSAGSASRRSSQRSRVSPTAATFVALETRTHCARPRREDIIRLSINTTRRRTNATIVYSRRQCTPKMGSHNEGDHRRGGHRG